MPISLIGGAMAANGRWRAMVSTIPASSLRNILPGSMRFPSNLLIIAGFLCMREFDPVSQSRIRTNKSNVDTGAVSVLSGLITAPSLFTGIPPPIRGYLSCVRIASTST